MSNEKKPDGQTFAARQAQLIEQAKALLMERRGISEEEAHRYLQKTSMENGTNLPETASMILSLLKR